MIGVWLIEKCKGVIFRLKRLSNFFKGYIKAGTEGFIPINEIKEFNGKQISIACRLTGGLGDYIVASKFVDELNEYAICNIDIYCENLYFGQAVFEQRENVKVLPAPGYYGRVAKYDLSILIEHYIHVNAYNANRLANMAPKLYEKVFQLKKIWKKIYVPIEEQAYREAIHFRRCKILGYDRWTEMRMGGIFKIENKTTHIPIIDSYYQRFEELKLADKTYITLNFGADSMGKRNQQIKMWPLEYYNQFIVMFRELYPNIKIIQLGTKNTPYMKNADYYIMNESLETVKWILKNSSLHIDCEGGLVHLATQLDTKCIVIFGPTPLHMYGYTQNINLVSTKCSDCMGLITNWAFECYRGLDKPICIYDITPDIVINKVKEYFER